jgi:hypothetical protein
MANNPIEQSPQPELPPADDSALSLEQDSQTDETDRAIDEIQHNDSDTNTPRKTDFMAKIPWS